MSTRHFEDTSLVSGLSLLAKTKNLQLNILANRSPVDRRVYFECDGKDLDFALQLIEEDHLVGVKSLLQELRNIRRTLFITKGAREE